MGDPTFQFSRKSQLLFALFFGLFFLGGGERSATSVEVVRFAVIGDYGLAGDEAADVARLVKNWNPDFIITTGDNNYFYGEASTIDENVGQYYHEFIYPYTGIFGQGATINRFFPSLGNHDWGTPNATPYLDYFTLPGNERYYDFTWGPVHLFAIDSDWREPDEVKSTSVQAQWLQNALTSSSAPWKVVYMHHPPYSSGPHGSSTWMQWPYEAWGASAVLAGHDHTYERIVRNGFPYFVNGLGGNQRYSFKTPVSGSQVRYNTDFGAVLVEATPTTLSFQFVSRAGQVVDTYLLDKDAPKDNQPPTVNAGQDQGIFLGEIATLEGMASDDGKPNADLKTMWSAVSGPGSVTFKSPTSLRTPASFTAAGTYILRLEADDGEFQLWDEVTITVSASSDVTAPVAGPVGPSNTRYGNLVDSPFDLSTSFTEEESLVTSCQYTIDGGSTWHPANISGNLPTFTCTKTAIAGSNGQALTLNMRATSGGGTGWGIAVRVKVDTAPPTGKIQINKNASFANSTSVQLSLSASDASGVSRMCVSNMASCSLWELYKTSKSWTLLSGDGIKTVYVWFQDHLGHANATPFTDQITLDTVIPTNPTSVFSNSHSTNVWSRDRTVDVSWSGAADDRSGVYGYSILWDRSSTTLPDAKLDTTGTKRTSPPLADGNDHYFHIRTVDRAGNAAVDAVRVGPFLIDGTPPVNGTLSATAGSGGVSLAWSGFSDPMSALASANAYKLVFSTSGYPGSRCTSGNQIFLGTGQNFVHGGLTRGTAYYYRVCAFDNAGNVSTGATGSATPQ